MSADNWTVCPRCLKNTKLAVEEQYGKLPKEEYDELVQRHQRLCSWEDLFLGEDYELGVHEDGEFYVSYSCSCEECGFGHNFTHREKLMGAKYEKTKNSETGN